MTRPIFRDRGVADFDADLVQLGLDARLAPGRIRAPHVADQLSHFAIDSRTATVGPALPTPIGSEPVAVPVHDCGRLDQDEGPVPTGPATAQTDPEEPVTVPEPWPPRLPLEHHQLVPERYVLKREIPLTLQRGNDTPPHDTYPIQHRRLLSLNRERPVISRQMRFSPPTATLTTPSCGSFCHSYHVRGEFSPTHGRRLQFFENLVSSRPFEWTLVPFLRVVRGHGTTDDRLLLRRQVHDPNLTVSPGRLQ